ncbi:sigma 54-interacting transcriptional regulator [Persicobacter sp. CCB-QB2]|uniref:sigma 54-interacting transcriptional regulator n=1 Tax=Persicobacter sp. CCB-QB2 TaxID=1561025 RepID=UPI0006A99439|nr:sigma 54-interacting transcriptional regulator [Persicobacter sp. CCB-QB2]
MTNTPKPSPTEIKTFGALKKAGFQPQSTKAELRKNLIQALQNDVNPFKGIHGYEETVIPELQRAILAGHNINLLGLRGQAKTRIARLMTNLLDEYIPYIEGSEINDDPFHPLSFFGRQQILNLGDETPIAWLHRDLRYVEKLATPDVTVADLIGDIDPIKAAAQKLSYSDERIIHFGLIPRSNRGIFVINELPDLQARIQVALFNILQEGDIQIRGFQLRLPLDLQFVFTANPEDYTNRGSIVTPLKDRIESQIITHYPPTLDIGEKITRQEAKISAELQEKIHISPLLFSLIEQIAAEARESEYVDGKSGVSARLTISALETLYSTIERRMLINGESTGAARIADFLKITPAITGKVELVYEGEQEGAAAVAANLMDKAIRIQFEKYFPSPEKARKEEINPYGKISDYFEKGNVVDVMDEFSEDDFTGELLAISPLTDFIKTHLTHIPQQEIPLFVEFLLHGLAAYSMLSKKPLSGGAHFGDFLSGMLDMSPDFPEEEP